MRGGSTLKRVQRVVSKTGARIQSAPKAAPPAGGDPRT